MNNSNQSGILLLSTVIIGVCVFAFMFFGTEMENQNLSASYGKLAPAKSANLFSNNLPVVVVDASSAKEVRSDLSGITFIYVVGARLGVVLPLFRFNELHSAHDA